MGTIFVWLIDKNTISSSCSACYVSWIAQLSLEARYKYIRNNLHIEIQTVHCLPSKIPHASEQGNVKQHFALLGVYVSFSLVGHFLCFSGVDQIDSFMLFFSFLFFSFYSCILFLIHLHLFPLAYSQISCFGVWMLYVFHA